MNKKIKALLILLSAVLVLYYYWPEKQLKRETKADFIKVYKSRRKMQLFYNNELIAEYTVSLGAPMPKLFLHPSGPKEKEGDHKTPEGTYKIDRKRINQKYHRSLDISYPTQFQINQAVKKGYKEGAGGAILIHGLKHKYKFFGKFMRWIDWTDGCIAVTNDEIEEIYEAVPVGCEIEIYP